MNIKPTDNGQGLNERKVLMNKLFTKIATFVAGTALAVGVGVALGEKGVREARADTYSYTFTEKKFSSNTCP